MRRVRLLLRVVLAGLGLLVLGVALLNLLMLSGHRGQMHAQTEALRPVPHALVLGTSAYSLGGEPSVHFNQRMLAAATLYRQGLVRTLLLSGANPSINYNEPERMRRALLELGVPEEALRLDYGGRRTLDSVRRARDVFGVERLIIVSQRYHLPRALFLAGHDGLEAQGFIAAGPPLSRRWRTELREVLARVLAVLDVYVLRTEPHFPAQPEEAEALQHNPTAAG